MLIGNRPPTSACRPFALGNSIASVIANEFTEATYDLYLSALVELGLVLLLVSVVVNSLARLLIWRVQPGRRTAIALRRARCDRAARRTARSQPCSCRSGTAGRRAPGPRRETAGAQSAGSAGSTALMTGVLGLCLAVTVGPLFLILGYLLYQGVAALNWDFFTKLPAPVGEKGGGMANALYGSVLLVGLATLFAVPVGLLAASTWPSTAATASARPCASSASCSAACRPSSSASSPTTWSSSRWVISPAGPGRSPWA